eukprot:13335839-Alexandrium_andersonii.AAC.1
MAADVLGELIHKVVSKKAPQKAQAEQPEPDEVFPPLPPAQLLPLTLGQQMIPIGGKPLTLKAKRE